MNPGGPLLLLGGTFDPPHIGHLVLAESAAAQFTSARVCFLPAGLQYRKAPAHSSAADRSAMLRLAIAGNPRFAVDDRELLRPGPTYTIETLEQLHTEGERSLVLLMGADALADLPNWRDPERIRTLATLVAAPRAGVQVPDGVITVDMPPIALSSTLIRERVRARKPIRYLVPDAVEAYIREHALYTRAEPLARLVWPPHS